MYVQYGMYEVTQPSSYHHNSIEWERERELFTNSPCTTFWNHNSFKIHIDYLICFSNLHKFYKRFLKYNNFRMLIILHITFIIILRIRCIYGLSDKPIHVLTVIPSKRFMGCVYGFSNPLTSSIINVIILMNKCDWNSRYVLHDEGIMNCCNTWSAYSSIS